ncbi:Crp/Fnr family transcriptional regulator [Paracoccus sanguinis]|uniref:cAMP-binding domain of CRP or a regulatory subunit of cAMP-dependent protein kinases n=1 Tax=Paracoccus sanguinis TaxID=1545044 RepID=A0A1H2UBT5_9RHOB|nr:cyclic nucleotide-binding domain-containing protein [Paracoccus sanguinis]KGJ16723.1 cyclic nucleotide-binding protein [Paracoccus sanguinis]QJD16926.1 cyclic nucleotide-binding domain-containing protein [Paracoccus sanguinis]SDW53653.1 cAMP-binding domain of CRP or a regulatory subunit of cAMP-dependent protein kinases [Paracoccus sanguinis]
MTPADQQTARQSPLLARLGPPVQDKLLDGAVVLTAETGQTLFLQDDPAAAVFILLDGWVKLYRVAPSGAEAVVSVMTRGRSFGEAVALKGGIYPVSAEAITPARLLRLDGVRLRHLLESDATLATSMLAATYVHLQQLVEQVEHLKARSGVQRVAEFLLDLAAGDGACTVALPYNKTLIAGRLGMKPESLSRAFARLRQHGVRIEAAVAHIDDIEALRELAAEDPAKPWLR